MKILVTRVVTELLVERIPMPVLNQPEWRTRTIAGASQKIVNVSLEALIESDADEAAWVAAVGKTLSVYEPDLTPDDWFVRCDAIYPNGERHLTSGGEYERCGFPSLDSPQWHLHGDEHAGAFYGWGITEVRARKEALAGG